jgi:glycosyltransferase involved in cell wall biosynthesis
MTVDSPSIDVPTIDVTVVLPVFNEVGNVVAEVDRIRAGLAQSRYTFEIVVVDDGSTDGSADELDHLDGIRVIRFPRNLGTGTARRAGTRSARGRVVVWTDADMTYPNDRIADLVDELEGWDQVVGARTSEQGRAPLVRAPAKWIMRRLAGYLTRTRIPDLNSGFRAFRRDVGRRFLHQLPTGFSCVTTMTMTFLVSGYTVKYVPIAYAPRAGRSKFRWWADSKRYLTQVVRLAMSYDPLRVFLPLAVALATIGSAKLVYDMVDHPFRVATNTLLVLFAALQVLVVGLLADLVVRLGVRGGDDGSAETVGGQLG